MFRSFLPVALVLSFIAFPMAAFAQDDAASEAYSQEDNELHELADEQNSDETQIPPETQIPDEMPTDVETANAAEESEPISKTDDVPLVNPDVEHSRKFAAQNVCDDSLSYPSATMRRAETAYTKRKYSAVIDTLKPLYDNLKCIDDPDTIIEIDLLLGVSHLELHNESQADSLFMDVLRTEPDYDPVGAIIVLPSSSTERIEKLRSEHAEELDALRPEKSKNTVVETLFIQGEVEQRPYWLNFMPFSIGLFQLHENVWGSVYTSAQIAGILMSTLGGAMVEWYRKDNYLFSQDDYPKAKAWQTTQIVGIALLGFGYLASVIHALIIYEPAPVIWNSPSKTPPVAAAPIVFPDGAGLAFGSMF